MLPKFEDNCKGCVDEKQESLHMKCKECLLDTGNIYPSNFIDKDSLEARCLNMEKCGGWNGKSFVDDKHKMSCPCPFNITVNDLTDKEIGEMLQKNEKFLKESKDDLENARSGIMRFEKKVDALKIVIRKKAHQKEKGVE